MTQQLPITIITPCYNESEVVVRFLERLEKALVLLPYTFHVIVVNDCSTDDTSLQLQSFRFISRAISLNIINLPENCGHQAAVYKGFLYAVSLPCNHFIVMDSDGQDDPKDIAGLLNFKEADIVHIVRGKRQESLFFRVCYWIYKNAFLLLTGKQMNFGNYCLINREVLEAAIAARFKHLPAFLAKQSGHKEFVVAARGRRLGGSSKMSFAKLCNHALNSFIEYWDGRKLSRLLPVMLLFLFLACQCNTNPKDNHFTQQDSLKIEPFALSLFKYEHYLASGYGDIYLITDSSAEIRFHHYGFPDSLLYHQKLKPSANLKRLSQLKLDSLDTFNYYHNPNIMDGCQILFDYKKNLITKTIWIENRYNAELGQATELINKLVPEQFKIGYDCEMFKGTD